SKIKVLLGQWDEAEPEIIRHRFDRHAPVGARLRDACGDTIVRTRLVPIACGSGVFQETINEQTRPGALVSIHHDTVRIGQRRNDRRFQRWTLKTMIAPPENEALHPSPAGKETGCVGKERMIVVASFRIK